MNLENITPIIITYNESPNIGRCLDRLTWAKDIIVVDSFSTDETVAKVNQYPQARVFQRIFTSFSEQCNYALRHTGIKTHWVLSLDADYILTEVFLKEIRSLQPEVNHSVGYKARFHYCDHGRALRGTLYPPVTILFLHEKAEFMQDGHAHRVKLQGRIESLGSYIDHDDRKTFKRWVTSQKKYAKEEAKKISSTSLKDLNWNDRIRKLVIPGPILIFIYAFFVKGLILDGWPGLFYCLQRSIAEGLLSLELLKNQHS